jgi:hypothetical protein
MPAESKYLIFDDLLKPVCLVDCDELYEFLPLAFSGWPFRVALDSEESPVISLIREDNNYVLEGALLPEPLTRNDMVDALCALVAELVRVYVHQDDRLLCLHGAAVEFAGKLVVFPSQYRAGKSILTTCLAAAGVPVFCDDVLPISRAEARGIAPGLALRLRRPLPDNLARESLCFIETHNYLQGEHYMYLNLDDGLMARRGKALPVGAFVLLERESGATTMLEDVPDAEVLRQVVWQNFAREAEAPEILAALSGLVADSQCFRLRYDRAEDACWLLQQEFKNWSGTADCTQANDTPAFELKAATCDLAPGYYRQNPEIKMVQLDNQSFLADRDGAAIHHLNQMGSAIWTLLADAMTEDEVVGVLLTAFPDLDHDQVRRDVGNLIEALRQKNLLHCGTEKSASS